MKKLIVLMAATLSFASTAFAELGSASSDLVFTPVTPCRIFDTRPSQGGSGAIAAGATKTFYVRSAATFAGQGGKATDCGMIGGTNVAAIAINVVVITPTTAGFITAYPADVAKPQAATVNFSAGDVLGNASVVKVSQGASAAHLSVFSTSQTDVAGDVVGYYSKPVATALQCETTLNQTSTFPPNAYSNLIGGTACSSGYTLTSTSCSYFIGELGVAVAKQELGACGYNNYTANTKTVYIENRCCRIPGR